MKFVTDLEADLITKIKTVAALSSKTLSVYSAEELVERVNAVPKPAMGVMYEGSRNTGSGGGRQFGSNVECVFSLILIAETSVLTSKVDAKGPVHEVLDAVRTAIHGTKSPKGNYWEFVVEAQASQKGAQTIWVQRWQTSVNIPPARI